MKTQLLFQAHRLFLLAALSLVTAVASESPTLLLEKGIYAEEVEQNLDSAIKIYAQISAEAAANRTVVAQAQYRLATCYRKKGDKESAIKLLQELLQGASVEPGMLGRARSALSDLGAPATEGMMVRKVPVAIPGWPEAMSEDGRFIAYEPQGGYDLAVFEVATGKTWTIAKCSEQKSPGVVAFSPDGAHIAYDLSDSIIYVAKIDGSETHKLGVTAEKSEEVWPSEWSHDSSQLYVECKQTSTGSSRLVAVPLNGGANQEIATIAANHGGMGTLSPNGRYLARKNNTYPRRITVRDVKSGHEETLVATNAGSIVGWAPNTMNLVFSRNRAQTSDLLAVEIRDGKPVSEPVVLRSNFPIVGPNAQPLGISRDGSIYYFTRKARSEPIELWTMNGFLSHRPADQELADIQTEIPPSELVTGPDNSVLDRKLGLSFRLPAAWTISTAVRRGNGGNLLSIHPDDIRQVSISIQYRPNTPWSSGPAQSEGRANMWGPKKPAADEVDAWLRGVAEQTAQRAEQSIKDFKRDPAGFVPRLVGGNKAVIWSGSYQRGENMLTDVNVHVFGEQAHAQISLRAPAASIGAIRPALDRIIESFRLP